MTIKITKQDLKKLFTKSYGTKPPTKNIWAKFYAEDVIFIDPTQVSTGLDSYILTQEKLLKRADDISLETHNLLLDNDCAFIEWTMILKIMGKEFIYPGTTRLLFSKNGLIKEHRDFFDFCGPTFGPIVIIGPFIRWLYKLFVS